MSVIQNTTNSSTSIHSVAIDSTNNWTQREVLYLKKLKEYCTKVSNIMESFYIKYTRQERLLTIPSLILTSANSLLSFGIDQFNGAMKDIIPITVGASSFVITILTAINSYMEISSNRNVCKNAVKELRKIVRDIELELSLDVESRNLSGMNFCRYCLSKVQTIHGTIPIFNILRKYPDIPDVIQECDNITNNTINIINNDFKGNFVNEGNNEINNGINNTDNISNPYLTTSRDTSSKISLSSDSVHKEILLENRRKLSSKSITDVSSNQDKDSNVSIPSEEIPVYLTCIPSRQINIYSSNCINNQNEKMDEYENIELTDFSKYIDPYEYNK